MPVLPDGVFLWWFPSHPLHCKGRRGWDGETNVVGSSETSRNQVTKGHDHEAIDKHT